MVYYNEIDPFAVAWLEELIKEGWIADGVVDTRPIQEVGADELGDFTQCHFFAGIGGWSYALRLAGWPDERHVWTGSCPCQPFSTAGQGAGVADERHLWPAWDWLISQCRPPVVFGEQVEAAVNHGWLDLVQADLEGKDYAFAPVGLPAASVGAPHARQRLWFVADTVASRCSRQWVSVHSCRPSQHLASPVGSSAIDKLGDTDSERHAIRVGQRSNDAAPSITSTGETSQQTGSWHPVEWLPCLDGKTRPTEPGLQPLADGVPVRVGRLRGYGNAIVPQVAATFIEAYLDLERGGIGA